MIPESDILSSSSALTAAGRRLIQGGLVSQADDQIQALLGAVAALEAAGIRAVLIGGLAVGVRSGVPRATIDVDLAADSKIERSLVVSVLEDAGFTHKGSYPHSENFHHSTGEPVQVIFDPAMDGPIGRAEEIRVGEDPVYVVTTDDLIAMKERAGSDPGRRQSKALRDLADAALLREEGVDLEDGW